MTMTGNEHLIALGYNSGLVKIVDTRQDRVEFQARHHRREIIAVLCTIQNTIITAANDFTIKCIHTDPSIALPGEIKWDSSSDVQATTMIDEHDQLFIGFRGGMVRCRSIVDGAILWTYNQPKAASDGASEDTLMAIKSLHYEPEIKAVIAVCNVASTKTSVVMALDAKAGELLWVLKLPDPVVSLQLPSFKSQLYEYKAKQLKEEFSDKRDSGAETPIKSRPSRLPSRPSFMNTTRTTKSVRNHLNNVGLVVTQGAIYSFDLETGVIKKELVFQAKKKWLTSSSVVDSAVFDEMLVVCHCNFISVISLYDADTKEHTLRVAWRSDPISDDGSTISKCVPYKNSIIFARGTSLHIVDFRPKNEPRIDQIDPSFHAEKIELIGLYSGRLFTASDELGESNVLG